MKPPCIVEVQHTPLALGVAIAKELIESHGLERIEPAQMTDLSPATMTRCLNKPRGGKISSLIEKAGTVTGLVSEMTGDIFRGEPSANSGSLQAVSGVS